jgi:hypothetical protein
MLSGRLGPDVNNRKQRCKKQQCQGANERTPKRRACCPAYSRRVEQGFTEGLTGDGCRDPRQYDEEHKQERASRMEN